MSFKLLKSTCIISSVLLAFSGFAAPKWKMAVGDGMGSAQEALGKKFVELVEEKSKDVNIEMFLAGQLGTEQATVNDIAMGTLEFSILASNNVAPFSPSMGILSLPYIFETPEQAKSIVEGPIGEELSQDAIKNTGARVLGWTHSGFRILTNSKHPVKKMADLKGLLIRVPKTDVIISSYQAWGINPTPMAWSETFTGLQQKVVDGQSNPYATIYAMKFAELQQYFTETNAAYLLEPLVVSESFFQEQSPEMQKILIEAGKEATKYSFQWLADKEAGIKKELLEKYKVEIDTLSDAPEWIKAAQEKVWPEYYDKVGGLDKVNAFMKALGRPEVK